MLRTPKSKGKEMTVSVNSAALEAVIDAASSHIKLREALGLSTVSDVLGEDNPVELSTCIEMLEASLSTAIGEKK